MPFSRERRAHLARKWHYVDGLEADEIAERMEREGIADLTRRTISTYLSEAPAEETIEKIRESHATDDISIAESQERKHDRAREDERRATRDEPIIAYRPKTAFNNADRAIHVQDWEVIPASDHRSPPWQGEHDVVVDFKQNDTVEVRPGEEYYKSDPAGNPEYRQVVVGVRRDEPDLAGRRSSRYEQKNHNEIRAQVLGLEEQQLNVDLGGSVDVEHSIDEDLVDGLIEAGHNSLDDPAKSDSDTDEHGEGSDGEDGDHDE